VEFSLQRISSIFLVVETKRFVGSFVNVMLTSKPASSARAGLGKANAELVFFFWGFNPHS
jgi:hypothetical protein